MCICVQFKKKRKKNKYFSVYVGHNKETIEHDNLLLYAESLQILNKKQLNWYTKPREMFNKGLI